MRFHSCRWTRTQARTRAPASILTTDSIDPTNLTDSNANASRAHTRRSRHGHDTHTPQPHHDVVYSNIGIPLLGFTAGFEIFLRFRCLVIFLSDSCSKTVAGNGASRIKQIAMVSTLLQHWWMIVLLLSAMSLHCYVCALVVDSTNRQFVKTVYMVKFSGWFIAPTLFRASLRKIVVHMYSTFKLLIVASIK